MWEVSGQEVKGPWIIMVGMGVAGRGVSGRGVAGMGLAGEWSSKGGE